MSDVTFRPMQREDFSLVAGWLRQPHVAEWWHESPDPDFFERKYGPRVDGTDSTRMFVIRLDAVAIGLIQTYRVGDSPDYEAAVAVEDAAGIDLLIGDPSAVGRGLGAVVIRQFVDEIVFPLFPEVLRCIASPSVRNLRSQRAFEKAGFLAVRDAEVPGESDPERVMVLERC